MINWNNYQSNVIGQTQNHYRDILPDQVFKEQIIFLCFRLKIINTKQPSKDTFFQL